MTRDEFGKQLNLETDWIPPGKRNRPGTPLDLKYITVHNTGNRDVGADAHMHAGFVKNPGYWVDDEGKKRWVSWHYTVDDKRVVRHLPINERGMHAGSSTGNRRSIGVEICMHKGIDQDKAFRRAARLIAALRYDLNVAADDVVPHIRWSGKKCPELLLNNGQPGARWKSFKNMVQEELDTIDPQL